MFFLPQKSTGHICHIESFSLVLDSFCVCVFGASHVLVCDEFRRLCLVMYPQQCSLLLFVTPCQTNVKRCRLDLKLKVFGNNIRNRTWQSKTDISKRRFFKVSECFCYKRSLKILPDHVPADEIRISSTFEFGFQKIVTSHTTSIDTFFPTEFSRDIGK